MKLITLNEIGNIYRNSKILQLHFNFSEYCDIYKNKGYKII